jgi:hypothetical protein
MSLLLCKNQSLVKSGHLIFVQETGILNGRSVKSLIKIDERGSQMACIAAAAGGVAATLIFTGAVSWPAGILIGGVLFISINVCGRPTVVLPDIKPRELSRAEFQLYRS